MFKAIATIATAASVAFACQGKAEAIPAPTFLDRSVSYLSHWQPPAQTDWFDKHRGQADLALAFATETRFGRWDIFDQARARITALCRSWPSWGHSWQSGLWASYAGEAGWLVWPRLTPRERLCVRAMVVREANYQSSRPHLFYADSNGVVNTPGDTKAEEDSWNARLVDLAATMFHNDSRASQWQAWANDEMLAAYAMPGDGLPGWNVFPDGTVINHGIIHPEYMNFPHAVAIFWHHALDNSPVPWQAKHNLDRVYQAQERYFLSDGNVSLFDDWGDRVYSHYWLQDIQARALGLDNSAGYWQGIHGMRIAEQMVRFDNSGRVYLNDSEFNSPIREPDSGERFAQAILTERLIQNGR